MTARFGSRAGDYARYRPDYPEALGTWIRNALDVREGAPVADLGAGTGIFSRHLLDWGFEVWAVEPNASMRKVMEEELGARPGLRILAGRAESTDLPEASVDLVTAAQAFHWFEPEATRREIARVAVPGAHFLFVWNARLDSGAPFREAYEGFLRRWGVDYAAVRGTYEDLPAMRGVARDGVVHTKTFDHRQLLDRESLRGRARSTSYLPGTGHPSHEPMLQALDALFDEHADDGVLTMDYETRAYWGEVGGGGERAKGRKGEKAKGPKGPARDVDRTA